MKITVYGKASGKSFKVQIDPENVEKVLNKSWHGNRYLATEIPNGKPQYLHIFLFGKAPNGFEWDHISGDRFDNRRCNLRIATKLQNAANRLMQKNNTSGYKGVKVRRHGKTNPFRARIRVNRTLIQLGTFPDKISAALAYNNAAIKYFGEYAKLNKIAIS